MNKKKKLIIAIVAMLAAAAVLVVVFLVIPNTGGEDDYADPEETQAITEEDFVYHEEEEDGAELTIAKSDPKEFYGTWKADSELAELSYGNLEITIKEGGVWTGNITDTDMKGKWTETDEGLALTSELFDCTLAFADTGSLVLIEKAEEEDVDDLITVLTKQ